jgi:hypothetical protein
VSWTGDSRPARRSVRRCVRRLWEVTVNALRTSARRRRFVSGSRRDRGVEHSLLGALFDYGGSEATSPENFDVRVRLSWHVQMRSTRSPGPSERWREVGERARCKDGAAVTGSQRTRAGTSRRRRGSKWGRNGSGNIGPRHPAWGVCQERRLMAVPWTEFPGPPWGERDNMLFCND